jgi:hypothetical protein
MTIGDSLTEGIKVIGHALHPMTVVADAKVALLEDAEPSVEMQNTRLAIAEKLSLDREPCLPCVFIGSRMISWSSGERVSRIHVTTMMSSLAQ